MLIFLICVSLSGKEVKVRFLSMVLRMHGRNGLMIVISRRIWFTAWLEPVKFYSCSINFSEFWNLFAQWNRTDFGFQPDPNLTPTPILTTDGGAHPLMHSWIFWSVSGVTWDAKSSLSNVTQCSKIHQWHMQYIIWNLLTVSLPFFLLIHISPVPRQFVWFDTYN